MAVMRVERSRYSTAAARYDSESTSNLYEEERPVTIDAKEARKPVKKAEFFMNSHEPEVA